VHGLSWSWIALEATVPPIVGVLCAIPFWRKAQMILGNIVASGLIFAAAMGLILREHVQLDRLTAQCLEEGFVCWPEPSAFARFALYASIGMVEVFAVFLFSLFIEERVKRRNYASEWQ
jgi:hypothetical protein